MAMPGSYKGVNATQHSHAKDRTPLGPNARERYRQRHEGRAAPIGWHSRESVSQTVGARAPVRATPP